MLSCKKKESILEFDDQLLQHHQRIEGTRLNAEKSEVSNAGLQTPETQPHNLREASFLYVINPYSAKGE